MISLVVSFISARLEVLPELISLWMADLSFNNVWIEHTYMCSLLTSQKIHTPMHRHGKNYWWDNCVNIFDFNLRAFNRPTRQIQCNGTFLLHHQKLSYTCKYEIAQTSFSIMRKRVNDRHCLLIYDTAVEKATVNSEYWVDPVVIWLEQRNRIPSETWWAFMNPSRWARPNFSILDSKSSLERLRHSENRVKTIAGLKYRSETLDLERDSH